MTQQYKISATSIQAFKACPQRFRLAYREGLRRDRDTEALRIGTSWHLLHEVFRNAMSAGATQEEAIEEIIDTLNQRYDELGEYMVPEEIAWERQMLVTSFIGYLWYYQDDDIEYLHQEIKFELPIQNPHGMNVPLANAARVGKIDHLIRWRNVVGVLERKSTTRAIDPQADYWDKSQKDTQVSMYALALLDMMPTLEADYGIELRDTDNLGNTLYDVWRRPSSKQKALTQGDTATFIETGEYCGQEFEVTTNEDGDIWINGIRARIKEGKKANAIIETPEMYGARLLADIQERPEYYFQRKDIARTKKQLDTFRRELYSLYALQLYCERTSAWYENESQCRATFHCEFIPVCFGAGAESVCDGKTTPDGFKRIFVDLTCEGQGVTEGE